MLKQAKKVKLITKAFSMAGNGEKKSSKTSPTIKGDDKISKNGKPYLSNSDNESSSTGSNESTLSYQVSGSKGGSVDSKSSSPQKIKRLSKSLRKKFFHRFPNVEEDEEVFESYSCALLSDILLQGSLYITTHYFGFYSNVFGYVTKILIPVLTVENITKEKTAKIFPNAIGIVTPEHKHVFGSFMSRDNTMEYMKSVWEKAKSEAELFENELESDQELDSSELEEDVFDEVDSAVHETAINEKRKMSTIITKVQRKITHFKKIRRHRIVLFSTMLLLVVLYISASLLLYRISQMQDRYSLALQDVQNSDTNNVYRNIMEWQSQLHTTSGKAVYGFLDSNLNEIAKVKHSLETLSTLLVDPSNINEKTISTD